MDEFLKRYLENCKVNYKIHKHEAVFTVSESKEKIKEIPGIRTKNLFLKDEKTNFYLVCMPGEKKLDIKCLKKELSCKKLEFGSPAELKDKLNSKPGSVSIFGMIYAKNTFLIIDKVIWDAEVIGCHPNINTETLEIKHLDLERFCNSLKCKKEIMKL